MKAQVKLEWRLFTRNTKNRILFFIVLVAAAYYGLVVAPQFQPQEPFERELLVDRLENYQYMLDNAEEEWERVIASAEWMIPRTEAQIEAYDEENWTTFFNLKNQTETRIREEAFGESDLQDPRYLEFGERFPRLEERYWIEYHQVRYDLYVEEGLTINQSLMEERTALQTIQRLLEGSLSFFLIAVLIFYGMDTVTKNKAHPTVTQAIPLSFGKQLWAKGLVTIIAFGGTVLAGALVLILTIGPRFGVGSLNIPIPTYGFLDGEEMIQVATPLSLWFAQAIGLFTLIALIFTRGMQFLSLLIPQELINLVVGLPVIFAESLYFQRGVGFFSDKALLPPTFFSVGSVLTGYHNHLYLKSTLTFETGMLSLFALWMIIELLLIIYCLIKPRLRRI